MCRAEWSPCFSVLPCQDPFFHPFKATGRCDCSAERPIPPPGLLQLMCCSFSRMGGSPGDMGREVKLASSKE